MPGPSRSAGSVRKSVAVRIGLRDAELTGDLTLPEDAGGIVLFAHGTGSSRSGLSSLSAAEGLHRLGLGTLLFDILTEDEEAADEADAHLRFDLGLLTRRLVGAIDWTRRQTETRRLRVGCLGAGMVAAAALVASAERPDAVDAVVSRGGRSDLALAHLARVRASTLLIVGGDDGEALRLNRVALDHLGCYKSLVVVPHATDLFEEPGALHQVVRLTADWFHARVARPKAFAIA